MIFYTGNFSIKNIPFALNGHLIHQFCSPFWSFFAPPLPCALGDGQVGLMVALAAGASRSMVDYVHLSVQLFLF